MNIRSWVIGAAVALAVAAGGAVAAPQQHDGNASVSSWSMYGDDERGGGGEGGSGA
ncbi:hypothetical protein [Lentzea sp.]|uniref:hypothetical protein n=1 Tax=Lentzea sp. TaxID=56099 RepID=UPI002C72EFF5|nr:hypothetical protein [Lentzea sp.]HUQ56498.1 hypothetical protein [Lentzea sp.]